MHFHHKQLLAIQRFLARAKRIAGMLVGSNTSNTIKIHSWNLTSHGILQDDFSSGFNVCYNIFNTAQNIEKRIQL
jgi:hypothetical protein